MPSLTKPQIEALTKLQDGKEHSGYQLQTSRNTLNALRRRRLVSSRAEIGAYFFPANLIWWKITALGQEILKSLPPIDNN